MKTRVAPWVASRVYRVKDGCRVAISNEREREFLVLEDAAALLWEALAEHPLQDLEVTCAALDFPVDEAASFVAELAKAGLLLTAEEDEALGPRKQLTAAASRTEDELRADALAAAEAEADMQEWAKSNGFLWGAMWELTYRCNESCTHCFNPGAAHGPDDQARRGTDELSSAEWRSMFAEMRAAGVFRLGLSGGEALLHQQFFDILTEARRLGFSVTVLTNGTLLDEASLKRLAALYPRRVELSVYSHRPEAHDAITRLSGSHAATLDAVRRMKAAGLDVAIKMVAMRDTIADITAFRALGEALDCDCLVDMALSPGLDGARAPVSQLAPTTRDLIHAALDPATPLYVGTLDSPRRRGSFSDPASEPCAAGHSTLSVTPEGNIYPCNTLPIYLGSIREHGFAATWRKGRHGHEQAESVAESPLAKWQSVTVGDFAGCGSYSRCAWCQKCAGMSMLETGLATAPSPMKCRTAAARLVAWTHLEEGGTTATLDAVVVTALEARFPHEQALWATPDRLLARVSMDALRASLKESTRLRVLSRIPRSGNAADTSVTWRAST